MILSHVVPTWDAHLCAFPPGDAHDSLRYFPPSGRAANRRRYNICRYYTISFRQYLSNRRLFPVFSISYFRRKRHGFPSEHKKKQTSYSKKDICLPIFSLKMHKRYYSYPLSNLFSPAAFHQKFRNLDTFALLGSVRTCRRFRLGRCVSACRLCAVNTSARGIVRRLGSRG